MYKLSELKEKNVTLVISVGSSGCLGGSLYGAPCELMLISAIIAVRNPDKCQPHLVRLHDRLWTCGAEMCPLTDKHLV